MAQGAPDAKSEPSYDDVANSIVSVLQLGGPASFSQLHRSLPRVERAVLYATLDALVALHVVRETRVVDASSNAYTAYVYRDGVVLPEPVALGTLIDEIKSLQNGIAATSTRINALEQVRMGTRRTKESLAQVVGDLTARDPALMDDPLYAFLAAKLGV